MSVNWKDIKILLLTFQWARTLKTAKLNHRNPARTPQTGSGFRLKCVENLKRIKTIFLICIIIIKALNCFIATSAKKTSIVHK